MQDSQRAFEASVTVLHKKREHLQCNLACFANCNEGGNGIGISATSGWASQRIVDLSGYCLRNHGALHLHR